MYDIVTFAHLFFFFQAEDGIRDLIVTFRRVLFFFQAEDGIRDLIVTGVQTCALLISSRRRHTRSDRDWSSDVCSSDLEREVADHASLAFPEMRSGLAPVAIMSYLGEYMLPRFAFPLIFFGEPIDPHRAQQIGLISQVCPPARLSAEADALVERILRLDPSAVRRCKSFFLSSQQNSFDQNCGLAVDALTKGSLALLARRK